MTYQEAQLLSPGANVFYNGRVTEVLKVERRPPDAIYLRLAGESGTVHHASVQVVPRDLPIRK